MANTNKTSNVTNMTFSHIDSIDGSSHESESVFDDAQRLIRGNAMNVGYDQDELQSQLRSHPQLSGSAPYNLNLHLIRIKRIVCSTTSVQPTHFRSDNKIFLQLWHRTV